MKWLGIPLGILLLFSSIIPTPAWTQAPGAQRPEPVIVRPARLTGQLRSIERFVNVAPDITLAPRGEGARHGQLWIRTLSTYPDFGPPTGLLIAGKVDGPPPDFPLTADMLPFKDHIEIWLATARDVQLPEIGWDNQFEHVTLPKGADSCEDWANKDEFARDVGVQGVKGCQAWVESQLRYREYFKRLFVRQWLVAPNQQMETFATPAFEHIVDWYAGDQFAQFMKPQRPPNVYVFHDKAGYSFMVIIRLDCFPPLPRLDTNELYLLVDIFNPAPPGKKRGVYSTSSPARILGKPSTFNRLRLDPPFSLPLTFCRLPLGDTPKERKENLTWVLPISTGYSGGINILSDTFTMGNTFTCGAWGPSGLSPSVYVAHHFSMGTRKEIGVWACGPNLTISRADKAVPFPFGNSRTFPYFVGNERMDYKRMPNGHLLLKFGPRVWEGHGCFQGGGAPVTELQIFDLGKDFNLQPALKLGNKIDGMNLRSQDFTVSADWSQVSEYNFGATEGSGSWSSVTWCLKTNEQGGYVYEQCGEKEKVQPPNPPVLKELRDGIN